MAFFSLSLRICANIKHDIKLLRVITCTKFSPVFFFVRYKCEMAGFLNFGSMAIWCNVGLSFNCVIFSCSKVLLKLTLSRHLTWTLKANLIYRNLHTYQKKCSILFGIFSTNTKINKEQFPELCNRWHINEHFAIVSIHVLIFFGCCYLF